MKNKLIDILCMIVGIPKDRPESVDHYKIKAEMVTPSVVRVNMKSLRAYLKTEEGKRKSGYYL